MVHLLSGGKVSGEHGSSTTRVRTSQGIWPRAAGLMVFGILLGRTSIEHSVAPFSIAFFAVVTELLGMRRSLPALAVLVGAFWRGGLPEAATLAVGLALYLLVHWAMFRKKATDIHWIPFLAGFADTVMRLAAVGSVWTRYDVFLALSEGALVVILSFIFMQCIPVLLGRESGRLLRHDQWLSLTILLGSVFMGMSGLSFRGISPADVLIDYTVMTLAAAGGIGVGTTVAIVMGVLAMISHQGTLGDVAILAFAALLAGVVRDAGRWIIGLTFLLCIGILSSTSQSDWHLVGIQMLEAAVAFGLFLVTPARMRQRIASYVPGTEEHRESEQMRVRRVHQLLTEKVNELGNVFDQLSEAFADTKESHLTSAQQLLDYAVGTTSKSVCSSCALKTKCWDKDGIATYRAIVDTVAKLEGSRGAHVGPTPELRERCIRIDSMMGVLRYNLEIVDRDAKWIEKMREQRSLVAAQLSGVANVVRSVSEHVDKHNKTSLAGEEQILAAFEQLGLYVNDVHIVSLDPGKVEVEVTQPSQGAYENSVRMIAPLLSGIVGENITVSELPAEGVGPCTTVFTSAKLFQVETAVATVARDGRMVSGDSYTSMDIGNGRYAVAVSDGMGNGERARRESSAAIELLKKLLKAGFDEQLAIKTVNSTLLLRSREEMFTTLDMALIDLYSARAEFLKIGSAPSFVKRGKEVYPITAANIPIGILQDIEVQAVEQQLQNGDILVLVSDGIYDAPRHVHDKDDWLRRQIERLDTNEPQEIADTLLEAAVRLNHGQIDDDMTVMVAVVKKYQPEWAAIRLPGVTGLRKEGKRRGA